VNNAESSDLRLEEQFKYCKKLRQQLEKVRLLNELVRKREKLKQEHVSRYVCSLNYFNVIRLFHGLSQELLKIPAI